MIDPARIAAYECASTFELFVAAIYRIVTYVVCSCCSSVNSVMDHRQHFPTSSFSSLITCFNSAVEFHSASRTIQAKIHRTQPRPPPSRCLQFPLVPPTLRLKCPQISKCRKNSQTLLWRRSLPLSLCLPKQAVYTPRHLPHCRKAQCCLGPAWKKDERYSQIATKYLFYTAPSFSLWWWWWFRISADILQEI